MNREQVKQIIIVLIIGLVVGFISGLTVDIGNSLVKDNKRDQKLYLLIEQVHELKKHKCEGN